jgi:hypothetical protein
MEAGVIRANDRLAAAASRREWQKAPRGRGG